MYRAARSGFATGTQQNPSPPRLRRDKVYLYNDCRSRRSATKPDAAQEQGAKRARETYSPVRNSLKITATAPGADVSGGKVGFCDENATGVYDCTRLLRRRSKARDCPRDIRACQFSHMESIYCWTEPLRLAMSSTASGSSPASARRMISPSMAQSSSCCGKTSRSRK